MKYNKYKGLYLKMGRLPELESALQNVNSTKHSRLDII
jgi:hypothetical protein